MTFTQQQFFDYIGGFLFVDQDDPNKQQIQLNEIKAALNNALVCIDCDQDGIAAVTERNNNKVYFVCCECYCVKWYDKDSPRSFYCKECGAVKDHEILEV
jgi:hypothetical protein